MQENSKAELVKRYIFFLLGLFVNSLGVACITKANLGTSPITSVPYVLSLAFRPTIGQFTIVWSLLLVAVQILLLRRSFQLINLLQIPVSILFGFFIDFSMDVVLGWLAPGAYPAKLVSLLIGCVILGFGVFMEVAANVVMLPGEATSKALTQITGREFGTVKICVDVTMCVTAVVISLILLRSVQGVREGTVIAALLVGAISKVFSRCLNTSLQKLFQPSAKYAAAGVMTEQISES